MRGLVFVAMSALAIGIGCSTAEGDPTSNTSEAVTTAGDWNGFTGGQCVHGVYQFYLHRFGIDLTGTCAQAGNIGNCENCGACMIWQSGKIHPNPALFNQYAWGTTKPQTYDIVVYPPRTAAVGPGHVACVDHIESNDNSAWQAMYVMDSNYTAYEQMAPAVHTVSRAPYGIFRLKKLDVPAAPLAKGFIDSADCTAVQGWSQDPSDPKKALPTDVYFNGPAGDAKGVAIRTTANISRPDLCAAIGSCEHGYSLPLPRGAMDGTAHPIFAYGITGAGTNGPLDGSPKSVTCAVPPIAEGSIKRHVTDPTSYTSWKFNAFVDTATYSNEEFIVVKEGAPLDATPAVVKLSGGDALYVIDGGKSRLITSMTAFAAWRFSTDAIKTIDATDFAKLSVGLPWPNAPLLAHAAGGADIYMLDNTTVTSAGATGDTTVGLTAGADNDATGGCSVNSTAQTNSFAGFITALLGALVISRRKRSLPN